MYHPDKIYHPRLVQNLNLASGLRSAFQIVKRKWKKRDPNVPGGQKDTGEDVEAVSDGYSHRLEVRVPPGLIEQNIQPTDPNFQARGESVERGRGGQVERLV